MKRSTSLAMTTRFSPTPTTLAAIFLLLATSVPLTFAAESKPIRSVTIGNGYIDSSSTGDEWSPTWAEDGNLYTNNDDGSNFGGLAGHRNMAFGKITGNDPFNSKGATINPPHSLDYGFAGEAGADGANWKSMNTYCVDGILYMGIARCFYPEDSGDPLGRHRFCHSSIIKSTDHGLTWTRPPIENYHQPMFPGDRFGALYFVWYGQNGAVAVDNADKFVYAVSTNGRFEDGDYLVLGRVLKTKLPDLNAADWQFYSGGTGGDGMLDANWSRNMILATPILKDAYNLSMTGITYLPDLKRYVMVEWHYSTKNLRHLASTTLDFYESPKPWGPFTKFATYDCGYTGYYCPIIGQKYQTAVGGNRVDCIMYCTGNYIDPILGKMISIPVSFYTSPQSNTADDNFTGDKLSKQWKIFNGEWSVNNHELTQKDITAMELKKAIFGNTGVDFGPNQTITALVKVNSWSNVPGERTGVSLFTDPYYGKGYNLVFAEDQKTVRFLDDSVIWGPRYKFDWTPGVWYWFKLKMADDVLYGKIWPKGKSEPEDWPYRWATSSRTLYPQGYPALNGGLSNGDSVSFAEVTVTSQPTREVVRSTGGNVTARGENPPFEKKECAFDGEVGNKWLDFSPTSWIQYQFADNRAYKITKYKMTSTNDSPERDPVSWTLKGSNDGNDWTDLDSKSDQRWSGRFVTNVYEFPNSTAYKYYRFGGIAPTVGSKIVSIAEIKLIGDSSD
jgi:hypothetical protein